MIKLSKRLQTICDLVPSNVRICDVGCDHAYVDIRLLQEGRITGALAMDVADGPLATAKANLELTELYDTGRCELRKSNGLAAYEPGEADVMICAGMGGILMESLLEAEPEKAASFRELLLSPQSEIHLVRDWLLRNGFLITEESFLEDEGKYYTVMRCVPGNSDNAETIDESSALAEEKTGMSVPGADPDADQNAVHVRSMCCQLRPAWEEMADRIDVLPEEILQKANVNRESVCKLLREPSFQSMVEKLYGPCILKTFFEGKKDADDIETIDAVGRSETAASFERFLVETLRGRLRIAGELTRKDALQQNENLQHRLQEIQTDIGVFQTLLAVKIVLGIAA